MPWKEKKRMESRIEFVVRALQEGVNFSELCREFGITRRTGYKWLDRYHAEGGFAGLREHSRRPHTSPARTPPAVEERVLQWRRRHGWGGRKICVVLHRDEGQDLKEVTANRILRRHDCMAPEASVRLAVRRFERERPNELWQMDCKGDYAAGQGRCYPLSVLDDFSRYAVGLVALATPSGEAVHAALVTLFTAHGVPEEMLMDHGAPWWSSTNGHGLTWVSVALIKQGIRLRHGRVRHPQTQGKVERFHATLAAWIRHQGAPTEPAAWSEFLARFREEYNTVRPHEALDQQVPACRYRPSATPYNPTPPEWEYPEGADLRKLNSQGSVTYRRGRYFVCEALAGEWVRLQEASGRLVVSYRHMYIREIDLGTGHSRALLQDVPA